MANRKGDRRERELVTVLEDSGWMAMRIAASGAGKSNESGGRELPDVHAGDGNVTIAIEAKSSAGDPIYLKEREIEELRTFAEAFKSIPLVGFKFDVKHGDPAYGNPDDPGWYFFDPELLYRTDAGSYRVKKTSIPGALTVSELHHLG